LENQLRNLGFGNLLGGIEERRVIGERRGEEREGRQEEKEGKREGGKEEKEGKREGEREGEKAENSLSPLLCFLSEQLLIHCTVPTAQDYAAAKEKGREGRAEEAKAAEPVPATKPSTKVHF
jgi:hypothetical protein